MELKKHLVGNRLFQMSILMRSFTLHKFLRIEEITFSYYAHIYDDLNAASFKP